MKKLAAMLMLATALVAPATAWARDVTIEARMVPPVLINVCQASALAGTPLTVGMVNVGPASAVPTGSPRMD